MRWKLTFPALLAGLAACGTFGQFSDEGRAMVAEHDSEWPGAPFTPDEVLRAFSLIMPEAEAAAVVSELADAEGLAAFTEETLLLFAVLSDETAAKVLQEAPHLKGPVQQIRASPNGWREIIQTHPGWKSLEH